VPEVITGVVAYYLSFGVQGLTLDASGRPTVYYGATVHQNCPRLPHFRAGRYALSFDDDGARQGYCLLRLGCKGPLTYNACTTLRWNGATSSPMHSGHGCLGCAQPAFWDQFGPGESGFYSAL
jgi:hydrogenase small subunit